MSINRNLAAPRNEYDHGKSFTTRTGKVIHRLEKIHTDRALGETSCAKFLPVMIPTKVTREERKGRWGVLLGGGTLPTCSGCLAAHYAAVDAARLAARLTDPRAVALRNVASVPANAKGHEALQRAHGDKNVQDVQVGNLIYGYSRGMYRRGVVTKVTPTKVEFFYTTEGAINEAKRIHEGWLNCDLAANGKKHAAQMGRNWDHYQKQVRELGPLAEAGSLPEKSYKAAWLKEAREVLAAYPDRASYVSVKTAEYIANTQKKLDDNREYGFEQYVHCTTKSTKKDDIYIV